MDFDDLDLSIVVDQFPGLAIDRYSKTSDSDFNQNCIGFALGRREWWEDGKGARWIKDIPDDVVKGWIELFGGFNFIEVPDGLLVPGTEKIAIYAIGDEPMHVALQLEDGNWKSKLGWGVDIQHASAESLCGDSFGAIVVFMGRSRER